MKNTWKLVNKIKTDNKKKNGMFISLVTIETAIIGAFIWLIVGRIFLPKIEWLLCFIGYPAVFIGLFGGTIYLYNHEFA